MVIQIASDPKKFYGFCFCGRPLLPDLTCPKKCKQKVKKDKKRSKYSGISKSEFRFNDYK